MFMKELFSHTFVENVVIVSVQTALYSGILGYELFGIARNNNIRQKMILKVTIFVINALLALALKEEAMAVHMLIGVYAALILCVYHSDNGDNSHEAGVEYVEIINAARNDEILGMEVKYPVDMGNKYKKKGALKMVGLAKAGKYKGTPVGLIESDDEICLCPLKKLWTPNEGSGGLSALDLCEQEILFGGTGGA
jgi:hypothetical protein